MKILSKSSINDISDWYKTASTVGAAILIEKERDWTSFDVVNKLKRSIDIKKIGHAGTLDPLATGLLIICCGKATKQITTFQDMPKVYSGIIKLGAITKTFDSEGEEEEQKDVNCNEKHVLAASEKLTGVLMQTPPMFSARKYKGKRLYKLARKNIEVKPMPKEVEVYNFDIIKFENPFVTFKIKCSKGTYIRSLARDMGEILGVGGYLYSLIRESIGEYNVNDAPKVNEVVEAFKNSIIDQDNESI